MSNKDVETNERIVIIRVVVDKNGRRTGQTIPRGTFVPEDAGSS